ncbi:hypothetical protein KY360_01580 [Candidatus Woesearchaeota archaeon]|nr:hypothetical protein [Candidatus Woesearchaeota archaeon]
MKVAVSGAGRDDGIVPKIAEKAKELGKELAKQGHVLLTGGCGGYPKAAAQGALEENGKVVAYSPAKDEDEHKERYGFPMGIFTEVKYTGAGIPERNIPLVKDANAVIMIGGQTGTLNEFTLAFHEGKAIGVLKGSGGVTDLIPKIADVCDKIGEKDLVVYSDKPKELVKKLMTV